MLLRPFCLVVLLASVSLAGCGLKGPLYMPTPPSAPAPSTPPPTPTP
ncbi:MAG: LPS translocon maturation chaperone LptM [Aeromonas sp.]